MNKKKLCLFTVISLVVGTLIGLILYFIVDDINSGYIGFNEDNFDEDDFDTEDDLEFLDEDIYQDF